MEKANEYAVESLKQIITLASAILALTITFLKDVLGEARHIAVWVWLVPLGWACLLVSIWLAWMTIVAVADELGRTPTGMTTTPYALKSDRASPPPCLNGLLKVLSWFVPAVPTAQKNMTRKLAASAQHYFFLGLLFLGVFGGLNLNTAFRKPQPTTQPQVVPKPQASEPPAGNS